LPRKEDHDHKIGGACFIRLASLVELGRLACPLERAPFPLFAFAQGKSVRIAAQADLYMGTSIFYYVDVKESGEFLAYRNSNDGEEVTLVGAANNASYLYAPVIRVDKMPEALLATPNEQDPFMSARVEDLASLVKVGMYRMLFEEPPLPLFSFKEGEGWILGTFARIDDYEEASIFFYTRMDREPPSGFVKYAPDKISETSFATRTDEHGFYPIKVIKLAEPHPLVRP
jgi:hypothetical protein